MFDIGQRFDVRNAGSDHVSNVLKWVLLITAIICFTAVGLGTYKTYLWR